MQDTKERARQLCRMRNGRWVNLEISLNGCGAEGRLSICGTYGHTLAHHQAKGFGRGCEKWDRPGNGTQPGKSYHIEGGGQCVDEIVAFFPEVAHWMPWHLNDMRSECEHQEALGWREAASEERTLYYWRLRPELAKERRDIVARAEKRFRAGEVVQATPEERRLLALRDTVTTITDAAPVSSIRCDVCAVARAADCSAADCPDCRGTGFTLCVEYVANGPQYTGDHYNKTSEIKTRGWLREDEHPDGLLSKACPTCGYKRGNAWLKRELPAAIRAEVEAFLTTGELPKLPEAAPVAS